MEPTRPPTLCHLLELLPLLTHGLVLGLARRPHESFPAIGTAAAARPGPAVAAGSPASAPRGEPTGKPLAPAAPTRRSAPGRAATANASSAALAAMARPRPALGPGWPRSWPAVPGVSAPGQPAVAGRRRSARRAPPRRSHARPPLPRSSPSPSSVRSAGRRGRAFSARCSHADPLRRSVGPLHGGQGSGPTDWALRVSGSCHRLADRVLAIGDGAADGGTGKAWRTSVNHASEVLDPENRERRLRATSTSPERAITHHPQPFVADVGLESVPGQHDAAAPWTRGRNAVAGGRPWPKRGGFRRHGPRAW